MSFTFLVVSEYWWNHNWTTRW